MIIPHIPTERTKYSDEKTLNKLKSGPVGALEYYCVYVLWDTSTTFMIENGMPTDADVKEWIKVLETRTDIDTAGFITDCVNYIAPEA